jgi:hypothetical protein
MEARTAAETLPSRSQTSWPLWRSVATQPKLCSRAVKSRSTKLRSKKADELVALDEAAAQAHVHQADDVLPAEGFDPAPSFSRSPAAATAPTKAPMEQPLMICGSMPSRASARNTPICAQPRAEPLPRAMPMRGCVSWVSG